MPHKLKLSTSILANIKFCGRRQRLGGSNYMRSRWLKHVNIVAFILGSVFALATGAQTVAADTVGDTALPGFAANGSQATGIFNDSPDDMGGSDSNASTVTTYNSRRINFGSGQAQIWTNGKDVSFDHDWTMSYWTLIGQKGATLESDGMAFVIQPNGTSAKANTNLPSSTTSLLGTTTSYTNPTTLGETLGLYGNEYLIKHTSGLFGGDENASQDLSYVIKNTIPDSLAFEFDNYNNALNQVGEALDYNVSLKKPHVGFTYPDSNGEYTKISSSAYAIKHYATGALGATHQWYHVTFVYNKSSNTLSYYYDDRDPSTNTPTTPASKGSINIDFSKMGGKQSSYNFGFTSFDRAAGESGDSSQNRVILDTYSQYVDAKASGKLEKSDDKGKNWQTVNENDTVYGTNQLRYTLTLTNNSDSSKTISEPYLQAKLPGKDYIDWDTSSVTDIDSATGQKLKNLAPGESVDVVVSGTATNVTEEHDIAAADFQFRNGGADSYVSGDDDGQYSQTQLHSPAFKLAPGYLFEATSTAKDVTVLNADGSHPDVKDTTVFAGDKLEYTFDLKCKDKGKGLDWNDVKAQLFSAEEQKQLDLSNAEGEVTIDGQTHDLTTSDLTSGYTISGSMWAHGDVKFTVTVPTNTGITGDTVVKDASQYTNDVHTEKPETPADVTVHPLPTATSTKLTVDPDEMTVDYTGLPAAGMTGHVEDVTNSLSNMLGLNVTVNNGDLQRLVLTPAATANYSFAVSTGDADTVDNGTASIKQVLTDVLDDTKTNLITLQAIDGDGHLSAPVTVKAGKFDLDAGETITFNDESALTGQDWDLAAKPFTLDVKNTIANNWTLSAKASALTDADGNELPGHLIYRDGTRTPLDDSSRWDVTNGGVTIDTGTLTSTSADTTDVSKDWTHQNILTADDGGKGLFVEVDGNATPGNYQGTITWTLTKGPQ